MTLSLLNEIKIEIRSLLISSQHGLSDDELCRDYSRFNSQRSLPYKILGYLTVTDFLDSLTDILYRSSNGYIHPIADQSTEHILKLVQQQRKTKQKKKITIKRTIISNDQQQQWNQSKPSICRNRRKRAAPSIICSGPQQIRSTVDANKPIPVSRRLKQNNIKEKESPAHSRSVLNNFSTQFERISVTNELLQRLLIHFRQQPQQ